MKKILNILFRLLFGLSLVGLGLRTLTDTQKLSGYVEQTIDNIQHRFLKKNFEITQFKHHSTYIVFTEAYLFIATGLMTIFGFSLAYILGFFAILIDLTLIHNVYFYNDQRYLVMATGLLGIFGGVISV